MNIQEATKQAMEIGGVIYKPYGHGNIIIIPTNTPDCCMVRSAKAVQIGKPPVCRWQPQAVDLMADDWDVAESAYAVPISSFREDESGEPSDKRDQVL